MPNVETFPQPNSVTVVRNRDASPGGVLRFERRAGSDRVNVHGEGVVAIDELREAVERVAAPILAVGGDEGV